MNSHFILNSNKFNAYINNILIKEHRNIGPGGGVVSMNARILGMAHQVGLALSFELVVHHSLTAAARHGPRRPDEEPDEWVGKRGPEALGQTEEPRRHAAAQISTSLLTERSCRTFTHHYSFNQAVRQSNHTFNQSRHRNTGNESRNLRPSLYKYAIPSFTAASKFPFSAALDIVEDN